MSYRQETEEELRRRIDDLQRENERLKTKKSTIQMTPAEFVQLVTLAAIARRGRSK